MYEIISLLVIIISKIYIICVVIMRVQFFFHQLCSTWHSISSTWHLDMSTSMSQVVSDEWLPKSRLTRLIYIGLYLIWKVPIVGLRALFCGKQVMTFEEGKLGTPMAQFLVSTSYFGRWEKRKGDLKGATINLSILMQLLNKRIACVNLNQL